MNDSLYPFSRRLPGSIDSVFTPILFSRISIRGYGDQYVLRHHSQERSVKSFTVIFIKLCPGIRLPRYHLSINLYSTCFFGSSSWLISVSNWFVTTSSIFFTGSFVTVSFTSIFHPDLFGDGSMHNGIGIRHFLKHLGPDSIETCFFSHLFEVFSPSTFMTVSAIFPEQFGNKR